LVKKHYPVLNQFVYKNISLVVIFEARGEVKAILLKIYFAMIRNEDKFRASI